MFESGPSTLVRGICLAIGATVTAYRLFHNFGIALAVGCALGVLGAVALAKDEQRRAEERWYANEERKRKQREAAGQEPEQSKTSFTL